MRIVLHFFLLILSFNNLLAQGDLSSVLPRIYNNGTSIDWQEGLASDPTLSVTSGVAASTGALGIGTDATGNYSATISLNSVSIGSYSCTSCSKDSFGVNLARVINATITNPDGIAVYNVLSNTITIYYAETGTAGNSINYTVSATGITFSSTSGTLSGGSGSEVTTATNWLSTNAAYNTTRTYSKVNPTSGNDSWRSNVSLGGCPVAQSGHSFDGMSTLPNNRSFKITYSSNAGNGVLWTPILTIPNKSDAAFRFSAKLSGNVFANTGNLSVRMYFVPMTAASPVTVSYKTLLSTLYPNPYYIGAVSASTNAENANFFTSSTGYTRIFWANLSAYAGQTGRIGIEVVHTVNTSESYLFDWFLLGDRPDNNQSVPHALTVGLNGPFNNALGTGLAPHGSYCSGGNCGGGVSYIPQRPNPDCFNQPVSGYGFQCSSNITTENNAWYEFKLNGVDPDICDCATTPYMIVIKVKDVKCAYGCSPFNVGMQGYLFTSPSDSVCSSTSPYSYSTSWSATNCNSVMNGTGDSLVYISSGSLCHEWERRFKLMFDGISNNDCDYYIDVRLVNPSNNLPITCSYILPVELVDFSVHKEGETAKLLWQTASEVNSSYFEIQRSTDAINFTKIGRVEAVGYSNLLVHYSFTDEYPSIGNNYYRLKQYDLDGSFYFSPIRLLNFTSLSNQPKILECTLNSNSQVLIIKIFSNADDFLHLSLFDILGKELTSTKETIQKGITSITIPVSWSNNSPVILSAVTNSWNWTKKIVTIH